MASIGRAVLASLFAVWSLSVQAAEHVSGSASLNQPCVVTRQGCVAVAMPATPDRLRVAAASTRSAPKSLTASAWTLLHTPEDSERSDFEPTYYTESGADGVWAIGHANYTTLALKFDALGAPIAHAYTPISMQNSFFALRYPDGGLLLAGVSSSATDYSSCTAHRIAADGRLLWSEPVSAFITEECGALGVDAGGAIWIYLRHAFPSRILRLSADGNIVTTVDLAAHFARDVREMIVDTASPGVWVGGSTLAADGQSIRARILRLDTQGQATSLWDSQRNQSDSEVAAMSVSTAYGLQAVLGIPPAEPDGYSRTWRALRLNAAGAQIHDRDIRLDRDVQVEGISGADDAGNWIALRSPDGPQTVWMMRLSLSGNAGALQGIDNAERCSDGMQRHLPCRIHLRQDGGAWFQVNYLEYPSQIARYPQLVGIDGDGIERFRQPVFSENRPTLRADDSILASAIVMYPPYVQEVPVPYTARFGDSLQPWADVRDLSRAYLKQPTAAFTRHGDPVVLGEYGNQGHSRYSRNYSSLEYFPSVDSGELPWRSVYAGSWGNLEYLSAGSHSVCFSGVYYPGPHSSTPGLRCHRRADGLPAWQWNSESYLLRRFVQPLEDGRSVSILDADGTVEHSVVNADGLPLSATRAYPLDGYALEVSFNESGDALLNYRSNETNHLISLDVHGTKRYEISLPDAGSYYTVQLLADGSALAWNNESLEHLAPNGARLWSQSFEDVSVSSQALASGSRVIMRRRPAAAFATPMWNQFDAFDLHSGSLLWSQRYPTRTHGIPAIAAIDDEHIGIAEADDTRLTWSVLDAASGNLLREQSDACGASDCGAPQLHLRADGRARMVMSTWSPQQGHGTQILGLEHAVDALPAVRADQAGISGAWYAPTSTGQGLMMQWLPSARTLFAPWFTYTKQGGNAHSALRWYALQGSVAPEALVAEVGIYRNTGGDFATGTTSAQRVGSATLRFESCERAHLHYRFDPGFNDDLEGVVTLTRLTPGQPCIGATNAAATVAKSASLGADFDGAWFDPTASGQGLMFSRYPSASGDSGTLFAPWFTFDPATAADDETEQHWFTLQGIYDGSGRSTLTIFRTTGGSFDATPTINTNAVGTTTLQRLSCDSATLNYRFQDSEIAGRFRGLTGTIALRKIGGCN